MKKMLLIGASLFLLGGCGFSEGVEKGYESAIEEETINKKTENVQESKNNETSEDAPSKETESNNVGMVKGYSKKTAENNYEIYPAKSGTLLTSKGDNDFTGYPYYFTGEVVEVGSNPEFSYNPFVLIRNENGYVMPTGLMGEDGSNISSGDTIEVWGTLTGEGFTMDNINNVVGESGFVAIMEYELQ